MRHAGSSDIKTAVAAAVGGHVSVDTTAAAKVLSDFYTEAGELQGVTLKDLPSVQQLIDTSLQRCQGIADTQRSQIVTAITDGINAGQPASAIASTINGVINDPARAQIIATTEGTTAYNAATTDSFVAAGISQFNWIAYDDACPECLELEAGSPYDVSDETPPDHVNCRCWQQAVIDTGQ